MHGENEFEKVDERDKMWIKIKIYLKSFETNFKNNKLIL
jgi:hypothetical protein